MKTEFNKILVSICVILIIPLILILVYKYDNERIVHLGKVSEYKTSEEYITIIDSVEKTSKNVTIFGCSIKLGEDINYINKKYVLIDEQNEIYGINTVVVERPSATEYFNDGFNYDKSGLNGQCALKYLDKMKYRIGILIEESDGDIYLNVSDRIIEGQNNE